MVIWYWLWMAIGMVDRVTREFGFVNSFNYFLVQQKNFWFIFINLSFGLSLLIIYLFYI